MFSLSLPFGVFVEVQLNSILNERKKAKEIQKPKKDINKKKAKELKRVDCIAVVKVFSVPFLNCLTCCAEVAFCSIRIFSTTSIFYFSIMIYALEPHII